MVESCVPSVGSMTTDASRARGDAVLIFGSLLARSVSAHCAPLLPADTAWRFIGKLQSNKAKVLVEGVPNLVAVETVDSAKLADRLQKAAAAALEARGGAPLDIYVQVNTSPWEGTKGGVTPEGAWEALGATRGMSGKEMAEGVASRLAPMGPTPAKVVGDGVAFLCSPAGRAVTGVSLPVDNGVHLKA